MSADVAELLRRAVEAQRLLAQRMTADRLPETPPTEEEIRAAADRRAAPER